MRRHTMETAAHDVASQIRAVEESIDAALVEVAELQCKMVRARVATGCGFASSHPAFARKPSAKATNAHHRRVSSTCASWPEVDRPGYLALARPNAYA